MGLSSLELSSIYTWGGAGLLLILSFIKIPKIEFNIWGYLGNLIGKSINHEVINKIDKIDSKCDDIEVKLNQHLVDEEIDKIELRRKRILSFNAELLRKESHTEEQFNEILLDIDAYETYCKNHPEYSNTKAVLSIENIKEVYLQCMKERNFLR